MAILLLVTDEEEVKGRIRHAKQILWHSLLHGWTSAREFHYQVLRELETGNVEWQDIYAMQMIVLAAAESGSSHWMRQCVDKKQEHDHSGVVDTANKHTRSASIHCMLLVQQ